MEFRYLGRSGLKISEITYGNWLTHGSQVENDAATRVRARGPRRRHHHLRHRRRLRQHRGRDRPRRGAEGRAARVAGDLHQGLLARPGPGATTTPGCPASTSSSRSTARCSRLQTDYVDLYQAHRYDDETPLEETMQAFADVVRAGKALYIGVSEWTADQIRAGARAGQGARHPADLQPAAVLDAVAGHRGRGRARPARSSASRQIVWSPIAQGVLTGKYKPGQPPPGGLARHRREGRRRHDQALHERRRARPRVQELEPVADELGLSMAQLAVAWVLQNDNVAAAIIGASRPEQVQDNVGAAASPSTPTCSSGSTRPSATCPRPTRRRPSPRSSAPADCSFLLAPSRDLNVLPSSRSDGKLGRAPARTTVRERSSRQDGPRPTRRAEDAGQRFPASGPQAARAAASTMAATA